MAAMRPQPGAWQQQQAPHEAGRRHGGRSKRVRFGEPDTAGLPSGNVGFANQQPAVVMAAVYNAPSNEIGVAVFSSTTNEIGVLQAQLADAAPYGAALQQDAFSLLQRIKAQVCPDAIFVPSRAEPAFIAACRQPTSVGAGDDEGDEDPISATPFDVCLERASLFAAGDKALKRLELLRAADMPPGLSPQQHLQLLNALVDLTKEHQLAALGALLAVMQKEGLGTAPVVPAAAAALLGGGDGSHVDGYYGDAEEDAEDGAFHQQQQQQQQGGGGGVTATGMIEVERIVELVLAGCLALDAASLSALQVFAQERHPSAMGIGKAKEGFSLFGVMNRCVTGMGRRLLRSWFRAPLQDLSAIHSRQDAVEVLVHAPAVAAALQDALKRLPDVQRLLLRMRGAQARPDLPVFKYLLAAVTGLLAIRDIFAQILTADDGYGGAASSSFQAALLGGGTGGEAGAAGVASEPGAGGCGWSQLCITQQVVAATSDELYALFNMVHDVVDFDQEPEGTMVHAGVCAALDQLKAQYQALPQLLTAVVEEELGRVPSELARGRSAQQLWSILYLPQVGYVMQVTAQPLGADLLDALPDYELAFETPAGPDSSLPAFYYRCDATRQLSSGYGDMLYKIQDLEGSLCSELLRRLLPPASRLLGAASAACAELDCLLSLARMAREHGYVRPEVTVSDEALLIKQGRHPLTELVVSGCTSFIPNDTCMLRSGGGRRPSQPPPQQQQHSGCVQVITGPNASGKSCYVKQVGLIVFMAHLGSFVPAAAATIPLTDRIFTRLAGSSASAGQAAAGDGAAGGGGSSRGGRGGSSRMRLHQSTFASDLAQVSRMLVRSTPRSLLIIDEFGKGTLDADGVGLLSAVLSHFATAQPAPPRVLACTHFHQLLQPQYLPPHPNIAFLTMQVMNASGDTAAADTAVSASRRHLASEGDGGSDNADDHNIFLYRLVPGACGPSFGLRCAQMCGVRRDILERAAVVVDIVQSGRRVPRLQGLACDSQDRSYVAALRGLQELPFVEGDDALHSGDENDGNEHPDDGDAARERQAAATALMTQVLAAAVLLEPAAAT